MGRVGRNRRVGRTGGGATACRTTPVREKGAMMAYREKRHNDVTVDGLARMLRDGRITRRGFLVGAAGLLGSMAAAEGLLARVAEAQRSSKNTLVVGQSSDVSKLDPQMSTTVNDIAVTFNVFDNLL